MKKKRGFRNKILLFLVYVIFGIYFLNFLFPILQVPEFIEKINDWIVFFGGILLLFSAFRNLRKTKAII